MAGKSSVSSSSSPAGKFTSGTQSQSSEIPPKQEQPRESPAGHSNSHEPHAEQAAYPSYGGISCEPKPPTERSTKSLKETSSSPPSTSSSPSETATPTSKAKKKSSLPGNGMDADNGNNNHSSTSSSYNNGPASRNGPNSSGSIPSVGGKKAGQINDGGTRNANNKGGKGPILMTPPRYGGPPEGGNYHKEYNEDTSSQQPPYHHNPWHGNGGGPPHPVYGHGPLPPLHYGPPPHPMEAAGPYHHSRDGPPPHFWGGHAPPPPPPHHPHHPHAHPPPHHHHLYGPPPHHPHDGRYWQQGPRAPPPLPPHHHHPNNHHMPAIAPSSTSGPGTGNNNSSQTLSSTPAPGSSSSHVPIAAAPPSMNSTADRALSSSASGPGNPPQGSSAASDQSQFKNDVDGRDGATSPSQIENSHRDEVQHMGCTCKKTRCLKLYCQCFGVKLYCGHNCRCLSCFNNVKHEKERKDAMRGILLRNPGAFDTKFKKAPTHGLTASGGGGGGGGGPSGLVIPPPPGPPPVPAGAAPTAATPTHGVHGNAAPTMVGSGASANASNAAAGVDPNHPSVKILAHKVGCKCRKSACMKKYCECYAGNVRCSGSCRCMGCKNRTGMFLFDRIDNTAGRTQTPGSSNPHDPHGAAHPPPPHPHPYHPHRHPPHHLHPLQPLAPGGHHGPPPHHLPHHPMFPPPPAAPQSAAASARRRANGPPPTGVGSSGHSMQHRKHQYTPPTGSSLDASAGAAAAANGEPWLAAQNLTFLKRGSPSSSAEKNPKPQQSTVTAMTTSTSLTDQTEIGSMPSLASSSDGSSPGDLTGTAVTTPVKKECLNREHAIISESGSGGTFTKTPTKISGADAGVNTLLLAAYAMTEFGKDEKTSEPVGGAVTPATWKPADDASKKCGAFKAKDEDYSAPSTSSIPIEEREDYSSSSPHVADRTPASYSKKRSSPPPTATSPASATSSTERLTVTRSIKRSRIENNSTPKKGPATGPPPSVSVSI